MQLIKIQRYEYLKIYQYKYNQWICVSYICLLEVNGEDMVNLVSVQVQTISSLHKGMERLNKSRPCALTFAHDDKHIA